MRQLSLLAREPLPGPARARQRPFLRLPAPAFVAAETAQAFLPAR